MNEQKANSFDLVSLKKLGKDVLILFAPQIALFILEALKTFDFGSYTPLAGLGISGLIYALKRYTQGS